MMEEQRPHDELKGLAPTLAGLSKREPFTVPEGFFERFPHAVQARVTSRTPAMAVWLRRAAIALPLVALLVASVFWLTRMEPEAPELADTFPAAATEEELYLLAGDDLYTELAYLGDMEAVSPELVLTAEELALYYEWNGTDVGALIDEP